MKKTPTHNHVNFEKRLEFVQSLFKSGFDVKRPVVIEPLQYDENHIFKYNNFVYKVTLPENERVQVGKQLPGCVSVPEKTRMFVLRLSNPDAESMNTSNRVENEVAIISLISAALSCVTPGIVPSVYAWESAAATGSQGWILQEFMSGDQLDDGLQKMRSGQKRKILAQLARIVGSIQKFQLPEGVSQLGGLNFDSDGNIVSDRMPSTDTGPWSSYQTYFQERMENELKSVDQNPWVDGWREGGLRKRLETFIKEGLPKHFKDLEGRDDKCIVHGDLGPTNILYDKRSMRITALLDYDFACISHPAQEFLHSFTGIGGGFAGYNGEKPAKQADPAPGLIGSVIVGLVISLVTGLLVGLVGGIALGVVAGVAIAIAASLATALIAGLVSFLVLGQVGALVAKHLDNGPMALRDAKLRGFNSWIPKAFGDIDWKMAALWEQELERLEVRRPSTISGAAKIADMDAISQAIVEWRLTNIDILPRQTTGTKIEYKKECDKKMRRKLRRLGY